MTFKSRHDDDPARKFLEMFVHRQNVKIQVRDVFQGVEKKVCRSTLIKISFLEQMLAIFMI